MARSFYPFDAAAAIENFDASDGKNRFYHQASRRHYEMSVEDGKMFVTRFRQRDDQSRFVVRRQRVDYVIGSGNHVRGYFYRNHSGEMFELPIVWYTQGHGPGL